MQVNANGLNIKGNNMAANGIVNAANNHSVQAVQKQESFLVFGSANDTGRAAYGKNGIIDEEATNKDKADRGINFEDCLQTLNESINADAVDLYEEMGIIADEDNPENILTVTERIKIELASHCDNYAGDLSGISADDIKEMSGKGMTESGIRAKIEEALENFKLPVNEENIKAVEEALKRAETEMPVKADTAIELVKSGQEFTIDNIYMSEYKNAGVNSKKESGNKSPKKEEIWQQLQPQVEELLGKNNLEVTPERLGLAKLLFENDASITVENILKLEDLNSVNAAYEKGEIDSRGIVRNIVRHIAYGGEAGETLISNKQPSMDAIKEILDITEDIKSENEERVNKYDARLQSLILENKELNFCGLQTAKEADFVDYQEKSFITAKKQLIEISILMSAQSGIRLMKAGISLELTSFEGLLERLKSDQTIYYNSMTGAEGAFSISEAEIEGIQERFVEDTFRAMEELNQSPARALAMVANEEIDFTISSLKESGLLLKERYEKAGERYETLGTEIRRDLGDSVKKAFSASVEGILEELGIEKTESSKRAVRILGYNHMEINRESIMKIKCLESEVERLKDNLKPATVVRLLKEGINPLNTDIFELNDELGKMNAEYNIKEESYAKFLWKLDNSSEKLSETERDAYIGLFRTFQLMAKDDYQAIGYLTNSGAELTIKNMVSAVRARREKGISVDIDDSFEGLRQIAHGNNLNYQLRAFSANSRDNAVMMNKTAENVTEEADYYEKRYNSNIIKNSLELMSADKYQEIFGGEYENLSLEDLNEILEGVSSKETNKKLSAEYEAEKLLREFDELKSNKNPGEMLKNIGENPSVANQLAYLSLIKGQKGVFGDLDKELNNTAFENDYEQIMEEIGNSLKEEGETRELQSQVDNFTRAAGELLEDRLDFEDINNLDLNSIRLVNKELGLLKSMSSQKNYQLPMEIDGETYAVNLSLISGEGENGRVKIELEDEKFGLIRADIRAGKRISCDIYCENSSMKEGLERVREEFEQRLENAGFTDKRSNLIEFSGLEKGAFSKALENEMSQETGIKTESLLRIAKIFLASVSQSLRA